MRAERLLSILMLLQVHRHMTAGELAARFAVSERTIQRDMEALSLAGVPVYAERGNGGGWRLLEEYRTNLTGLNLSEIQALFVQTPARLLNDLGLNSASDSAFAKLLASLPDMQRRTAQHMRERLHVDGASWFAVEEEAPAFETLQQALWQDRKLSMAYGRSDGEAVERLVDPLGLVVKGRIWYLIAGVEGELRTYRVSRVARAEIAEQPCARPADFDLAAYWAQSTADFKANLPQYPVTVRADPGVVPSLRHMRFARVQGVSSPAADGWVRVEILFELEQEALAQVLGFGARIVVVEPVGLQEMVVESARGVMGLYEG
ncbi:MAG: YafY family protein [Caldilineaceae bacterium]